MHMFKLIFFSYVTCSEKRDRWDRFIKIELLVRIVSSVCAEHSGEG